MSSIAELTKLAWPSLSNVGKFVVACDRAAQIIRESITPKVIGDVSYIVRRFTFSREDGWSVRNIGTISRTPVGEPERPGKFASLDLEPQAALTSFFEKSDGYMKLRDEDVWAVAVKYLNDITAVTSQDARTLENALNFALLARAGLLDIPGWQLYTLAAENPVKEAA